MKRFSKILSIGLSALMLLSGSSVLAGAATSKNIVKFVSCSDSNCKTVQNILKQLKNCKTCDLTSLIKSGGYCPDGNCSTKMPVKKAAKQTSKSTTVKPKASEFNDEYEAEVIRLVNAERAKNGLSALSKDSGAVNVARVRAKEIATSFSHTRPDGRSCFTAASDLGVAYKTAGENIAYGYATPAQVVNGWMNSEGHSKNILSASYSKIGVGCYSSNGVLYWSQFFIG
ncbi:MAG: CAP domain-containing protein [Ruminococcus sp.]|nr:CAP domain-containing protein [Ruminococcus sp.]